MKKFLSLVLALVMAMSLVTVSAGAKDFTDSEKLSGDVYVEAVDVMSTMGIIDGYADGSFQPQGTLTRGAAAKIIACMMLGKTTAEALGTQAAPFKDVPVGSTFAGYIAYCSESGIIDGYADGTFRPSNTLTGFAFLKMLLTALGYDSTVEGYANNSNWTVNVAGRAKQIGLVDGNENFVGTKAATREEACLYAVNALQATLVEYETKGTEITINGATISQAASAATYVTSNVKTWATNISGATDNRTGDYTVEFAEKYQPNLKLDADVDVFGRPAHTWSWKNEEIGQYVDYDLLMEEYTEKVTGKDLYNLLGKNVIDEYSFLISVDGETDDEVLGDAYFNPDYMTKAYDTGVGETGNGVLTQVFVDSADKQVYIAVINTYLAFAADDYDTKKESVKLDVYGIGDDEVANHYVKTLTDDEDKESFTVNAEDFDVEDVKEDDVFLVNVADGAIQVISDVEVLEDTTITAFSKGKSVTTGGTKYDYADSAEYDPEVLDHYTNANGQNLKDLTYNVYLDQYGYLIGVDLVEVPNNYLFLTGLDAGYSNLSNKTADGAAIFMDGSFENIKINMEKSEQNDETALVAGELLNIWCTYTVDKDGVYTLTEVADEIDADDDVTVAQYHDDVNDKEINKTHVSLQGNTAGTGEYARVYGNDATVYLGAKLKNIAVEGNPADTTSTIINGVSNVVTGIKNANFTTMDEAAVKAAYDGSDNAAGGVYALYKENGYVIAAVVVGKDAAVSKNLVYVNSGDVNLESYSADDVEWTWTREVIMNGVEAELTYKGDSLDYIGDDMDEGSWYYVSFDADGIVMGVADPDDATALDDMYFDNTVGKEIEDVAAAIEDDEDLILFYTEDEITDNLTMKGSTLYVTTEDLTGVFVAEDVKAVLIQTNNNKTTTTYETGVDELESMIDDMNVDADGDCTYRVSLLIEEGAATVVIIEDLVDSTGIPAPGPGDDDVNDAIAVDVVSAANTINVEIPFASGAGNSATQLEVQIAVGAALQKLGYVPTQWTWTYDDANITDDAPIAVVAVQSTDIGNVSRTFTVVITEAAE